MKKIYLTHATHFAFKANLYDPLKKSKINSQYEMIFPHEIYLDPSNSQEIIKKSNLILAEVSYPSTGQGIELGWADLFKIPIVCLFEENKTYSGSLKFVSEKFISYKDSTDLIIKLENYLQC